MRRQFYLDLAASGARFPIGSDLVLRRHTDAEAILRDGARLADVILDAARAYGSPLAFPVMDLSVEKAAMLGMLGVGTPESADTYHFDATPTPAMIARLEGALAGPLPERMTAQCEAIRRVAGSGAGVVPVGMSIGPFSLATKLLADPITPIYLAGTGVTAADDEEVACVEAALELSIRVVLRNVEAQVNAGAKAIFIAEPAANIAFFSPNQLGTPDGMAVFDRLVMAHHRRLRERLGQLDADLLFHCCGELTDDLVARFSSLDPALLSLGSSRRLWEGARLVPKETVLYGNLPTKQFYSDDVITAEQVRQRAAQLATRMRAAHHPFILGSECDVLSVRGCEHVIERKVDAMLHFDADGPVTPETARATAEA